MKKYIYKSEKGAISVFVMFAMLFFLVTVVGSYMLTSKRDQSQTEAVGIISNEYYTENEENVLYDNKIVSNSQTIPIYTKEQLWTVGTGKSVEIDGNVYQCLTTSNYELKNDIIINMDELVNSKFDYDLTKLNKANHEIYYFSDGKYYVSVQSGGDKVVTINGNDYYFSQIEI